MQYQKRTARCSNTKNHGEGRSELEPWVESLVKLRDSSRPIQLSQSYNAEVSEAATLASLGSDIVRPGAKRVGSKGTTHASMLHGSYWLLDG